MTSPTELGGMAANENAAREGITRRDFMKAAALVIGAGLVAEGCEAAPDPLSSKEIAATWATATDRLSSIALAPGRFPAMTAEASNAAWKTVDRTVWTSGFYPGSLWLLNKYNPSFRTQSLALTKMGELLPDKDLATTHDVGFLMLPAYGQAYAQSKDAATREKYAQALFTTADSLSKRFDPEVGLIRSWGDIHDTTDFQVIIDNMMNLELLFWAANHNGPSAEKWHDIAMSHATRTMKDFIRPDGSVKHLIHYDPKTGTELNEEDDYPHWARGQAWALHGFAMAYYYTGDADFLAAARKTANYFIERLPKDEVPAWSYEPQALNFQDASATAIAASGLLLLGSKDPQSGAQYRQDAANMLRALLKPPYFAPSGQSLLLHCNSGNIPATDDVSITYGDFYLLQALDRYKTLK